MLGAHHAPGIMFTAEQPALAIPGIAVGEIRRLAEDAYMAILFVVAHQPIVGNVTPNEAAIIADVDRTLRPPKPVGNPLDCRIADFVLESFIKRFDARIGVAPI